MTETASTESDPFFQLLTDALRAGPGSEEWEQAVTKLRDGGVEGGDELKLLVRAREDLAQGREFRRVTPGPEFTRKVLEAVEEEGGTRKTGLPTATIVAILCGGVILAVIITVIAMMSRGGSNDPQQAAVARLEAVSMPVSIASGALPGPLSGFELSTDTDAKRPASRLHLTKTLDPNLAATIQCEFVVPPPGNAMLQLYVSGSANQPDDLVLDYSNGRATADVAGNTAQSADVGSPGQTIKVSVTFDRTTAIVEAAGRRLFAGPHHLSETPRNVGLRFINPPVPAQPIQVKSISVAQSAAPAAGGQ